MYTVGQLTRVHPNGRPNYIWQPTSEDGLNDEEAAEARMLEARSAKGRAERALLLAEAILEEEEEADAEPHHPSSSNSTGLGKQPYQSARRRVDLAEAAVDRALENLVKSKASWLAARRRAKGKRRGPPEAAEETGPGSAPAHFSRIGALPPSAPSTWASLPIGRQFPKLLQANCAEVTLEAGNMLYLPCGWFHEVTSVGEHCALNFWFHPPDTHCYARPYRQAKFWKRELQRLQQLK